MAGGIDVKSGEAREGEGGNVWSEVRGRDGDHKFPSYTDLDRNDPRFLVCCVLGNSHGSVYPWV